jgi:hypothetical protein
MIFLIMLMDPNQMSGFWVVQIYILRIIYVYNNRFGEWRDYTDMKIKLFKNKRIFLWHRHYEIDIDIDIMHSCKLDLLLNFRIITHCKNHRE